MGYITISLGLIMIVQVSDALLQKCHLGTCSLRRSDNCTIKADTISFDEDNTFCHGHGFVIVKAGLEKPSCDCLPSYHGTECELDYIFEHNCTSSDGCNGGFCNGSKCQKCPPGWRGQRCEKETITNLSPSAVCKNGGTLYANGNLTGCLCACGFRGVTCSEMTSSVVTDPACDYVICNGEGSCKIHPETDTAYCQCLKEFYGQFCQYTVTEKTTLPTEEVCSENRPCLNGGTCVNIGGFAKKCFCACGFHGLNCEYSLDPLQPFYEDPCRYIPCLNNGTCARTADGCNAECKCSPKFIGTYCETAVKTTTKSPDAPCRFSYECMTDHDCGGAKVCRTVDACGTTQCQDSKVTESDSGTTKYTLYVTVIMGAFVLSGIGVCACFSRRYFQQMFAREFGNARARDLGNQTGHQRGARISTTSGTQDARAVSSCDNEGPPSYDEVCEKPPSYADVANGYKAMFEHPATRVQSISDCIHL